jgi:hypothetical protein
MTETYAGIIFYAANDCFARLGSAKSDEAGPGAGGIEKHWKLFEIICGLPHGASL